MRFLDCPHKGDRNVWVCVHAVHFAREYLGDWTFEVDQSQEPAAGEASQEP